LERTRPLSRRKVEVYGEDRFGESEPTLAGVGRQYNGEHGVSAGNFEQKLTLMPAHGDLLYESDLVHLAAQRSALR